MRVLVTEKINDAGLQCLRDAGHDVDVQLGLSAQELKDAIKGAHALIIRSDTQVTADLLEAADVLKAVGRAGVGVDNIDSAAATSKGIMVINAPTSNITSAAEHAVALMFALARKIPNAHRDLMSGQWNRSKYSGVEISGKKIGIVGLGHVGAIVAHQLSGFDVELYAYDPYVTPERAAQMGVNLCNHIEDLFATCDVVTVHLPKTPETVNMINLDVLKNSQPHLLLINAARGGIVNEDDLATALKEQIIAGAGLDVFSSEPMTESDLFDESLNVVVTPHLGASTAEAQERAGFDIGEQILLALADDFVPYALNLQAKGANAVVSPFISVAQVCARVAAGLATSAIKDVEVIAQGQISEHDCSMLTLSALSGILKNTTDEPVSLVNAPDIAKLRGISIKDSRDSYSGGYLSRVVVKVVSANETISVTGTALRRNGEVRLTQIDNYAMDVPKANHFLIVENTDKPGMVGTVGTILGQGNVNIDDMSLGRGETDQSMMVIATSELVPQIVVDELNATDGIIFARAISLI
ncbi:MAG: phosphoglycerate dehydrogenase [Acidimicrobiia bacterium]